MALEVLLGIGALGGGLVLMIAPRGEIMPLPLSALAGSPFDTYFVPGVILFGVLGFGPLIAAGLIWLRHPLAPVAALVVGAGLLIWVAVEVAKARACSTSLAPITMSCIRLRARR